jgi:hypothetical protein
LPIFGFSLFFPPLLTKNYKEMNFAVAAFVLALFAITIDPADALLRPVEKQALLDLTVWLNNATWSSPRVANLVWSRTDTDPCENGSYWGSTAGRDPMIYCDALNTTVTRLYMNNMNLSGLLPPSIAAFQNATILNFGSNGNILGPLPSEMGNLTTVQELYLDGSKITGGIPSSWSGMRSLKRLSLASNAMTGAFEPLRGLNLISFDGNNNAFNGTIDMFNNMTALVTLNLFSNNLTGTIPTRLFNVASVTL